MLSLREVFHSGKYLRWILFSGIFLAGVKVHLFPVEAGLDPSWKFGLNHAFYAGLHVGKDILFNYGPLFPLIYTLPLGQLYWIWIVFSMLGQLMFLYALFVTFGDPSRLRPGEAVAGSLLLLLLMWYISIEQIFVFLPIVCLLNYERFKKSLWLWSAAVFVATSVFIKASFGFCLIPAILLYGSATFWLRRGGEGLRLVAGTAVFAVLLWLALYGELFSLVGYGRGAAELASGFSSAMALYAPNDWFALGLFCIGFLLLPLTAPTPSVLWLFLLFAPTFFFEWKHSMVRECIPGVESLMGFVASFLLLFLYYVPPHHRKKLFALGAALFVCALLSLFMSNTFKRDWKEVAGHWLRSPADHISWHPFVAWQSKKTLVEKSLRNTDPYILPSEVKESVAANGVDCYPWELSYVYRNSLNWRPRPVFQAYTSYTPWLDRRNAQYYRSEDSAEIILWHFEREEEKFIGKERLANIDFRYLLNAEPDTLYEIFNNYYAWYRDSRMLLLKRRNGTGLVRSNMQEVMQAQWNAWIHVPRVESAVVRAKIKAERPWQAALRKFLYKDGDFQIVYRLNNGLEMKYRLNIQNASRGLWISPWHDTLRDPFQGIPVTSFKIEKSPNAYAADNFSVEWELVREKPGAMRFFSLSSQ